MITVDEDLTREMSRRHERSAADHGDVGHVMRTTGIKAVTLPGGDCALGWDMHNGTWGVLLPERGDLRGQSWRGGVVEPGEGRGFVAAGTTTLYAALRDALTMPSPLLDDGTVLDAEVADAAEAHALRDGAPAFSPRH